MHLSPLIRRALRAPCLATGGDPATPQAAPPGPAAGRSIRRGLAILLGITALGGLAAPALATPELVVLMRHGHKSGEANNYNLSPQGFERAIALASLLPRCFGRPSRILTFYLDPTSSKNARSYQTAVPLAVATGTAISIDMGSRQDSFRSGRRILSDPSLDGGHLVMFWEHRHLPELAAGLGWPGMPPIADDDFDQLIVLRYRPPGQRPEVSRYSQSLLLAGQQRCEPPPLQGLAHQRNTPRTAPAPSP